MQHCSLEAPGIPAITKRCETCNKHTRPLLPEPCRDTMCPRLRQEMTDNQKRIKNKKVRARAHSKKRPAKEEKETTADETRADGGEESENDQEQVAAMNASDGPQVFLVSPAMPWMPCQLNPNPFLHAGGCCKNPRCNPCLNASTASTTIYKSNHHRR